MNALPTYLKEAMRTLSTDALLAATLRAIGDAVISCDQDGKVVLMNPVAQQLTGWTEDEAAGHLLKEVFVILNETTRATVEDPVDKVLRLGRIVGLANHTLLLRRDGTEIAIDDSAAPVHDAEGTMRGVVLVFRDVSERRRAEHNIDLLANSGKILGEARDVTAILARIGEEVRHHFADFCIFDLLTPDGEVERTVGRHRDPSLQEVADALLQFVPAVEESAHPTRAALHSGKSMLMKEVTEAQMVAAASNPDHLAFFRDQLRPHSVIVVPMHAEGKPLGAITFIRSRLAASFNTEDLRVAEELTNRICLALQYARLREELRMERAQIEAIVQTVPVGLVIANASGQIVRTNDETSRIFRHEEILSSNVDGYGDYVAFHPDGRRVTGAEHPLARAMAEKRVIRDEHFLYQKGGGNKGWISLSAAPISREDDQVNGGVVAISDIDALVHAQQTAKLSQERIQVLMDRASVGIAIGDLEGALSYANETFLRWIGYTKEEIARGQVRWDELTPTEYAEKDELAVQQLKENGFVAPYEKAYVAKGGQWVPMLAGAAMIPSLASERRQQDVALFLTNLSLQKKAEAALLQAEKLTAVGRLASSISHEINNPLEAVVNLLYIVRNDETLSQVGRDYLDAADRELARVSQVTSQTLRFHRQSTAAMLVKPQDLLEEVLAIYKTRLKDAHVVIRREYGPEVAVMCYEGDIRQVLNNFVSNALAAMTRGGELRLRTRFRTLWRTGQEGVQITVADTGSGMPAGVLRQIFEAFFTTKGIHGTGLGLWISQRIVHKHRGHTRVKSSTGPNRHGTVFTLWLPLTLAASARDAWYADAEEQRLTQRSVEADTSI